PWNGNWKSMMKHSALPSTVAPGSPLRPFTAQEQAPAAPFRLEPLTGKLRLVISAGLLSWLAWRIDWDRIHQAFGHLRMELGLAAVGVYLLAQIISGFRWQLLARPLGFHEPLRQFTGFYFIGMYFNLLLPTSVGGDVVRAWCLDGKTGRRLPAVLSVLVDRISGLMILLLVACV